MLSFHLKSQKLDTVVIYENQTSLGYDFYKKLLYNKPLKKSYDPNKLTTQDKYMLGFKGDYLKLYDKKNRLLIEGKTDTSCFGFIGLIKSYRKNGKIFKEEYLGNSIKKINQLDSINYYDCPKITSTKLIKPKGKLVLFELVINEKGLEEKIKTIINK